MSRRLDALRAMADQTVSPREREIAQRKFQNLIALERAATPEAAWERRLRMEAEDAEREQQALDRRIADIVKRWEKGAYDGVSVRSGATMSALWDAS